MADKLLLPVLLLLVSLAGALILLRVDARRRTLAGRVSVVTGGQAAAEWDQGALHGIRVASSQQSNMVGRLKGLLKIPVDLPQANIVPVPLVFVIAGAAGVATFFISRLYFTSVIAIPEAIFSAGLVARGIFGWQKRRYANTLIKQLPDVIELLSATVTAGLPAVQGLRTIRDEMRTPSKEQFDQVMQEINFGASADAALLGMYQRTGVVEYSILAVTLGVQAKSGGRLVETVQTLAETIRSRLAIQARGNALAAEAKLSAYVIAAMPVVGGIVMSIIQPGYLDPLFYDPRGHTMLFVAVTMLIIGIFMMSKMIRASLSD
jgi:tight adherence protein B